MECGFVLDERWLMMSDFSELRHWTWCHLSESESGALIINGATWSFFDPPPKDGPICHWSFIEVSWLLILKSYEHVFLRVQPRGQPLWPWRSCLTTEPPALFTWEGGSQARWRSSKRLVTRFFWSFITGRLVEKLPSYKNLQDAE